MISDDDNIIFNNELNTFLLMQWKYFNMKTPDTNNT